ncbi:piggyBac transposable element-derived protein 4-like isoform X1 [Acipenser ruthenus]|uniref:piggyBac transposable element-derived protein 4-like isoform X1 n=2 Tax=Acipenser ruthenus TaxID=7906 RepID=UPI0027403F47|nr:piggyBac transposable element-derived protein 4-like isoform X1 [Acipenser ruthenus]
MNLEEQVFCKICADLAKSAYRERSTLYSAIGIFLVPQRLPSPVEGRPVQTLRERRQEVRHCFGGTTKKLHARQGSKMQSDRIKEEGLDVIPVQIKEEASELEPVQIKEEAPEVEAVHVKEISELEPVHIKEISELEPVHIKEISELEPVHIKEISELEPVHIKEISELEPVHIKEISELGWVPVTEPYTDYSPPTFDFAPEHPDIHPAVESLSSSLECFQAFLPEKVISFLCTCTNKRAAEYFTSKPDKQRKAFGLKWRDVLPDEMYVFLALVFLMGINQLPCMAAYWSQSILMRGPPVFCKEVMSRNRFLSIMKFLRFSEPDQVRKGQPRTRLEPFLSMIRKTSMESIDPGQHVAINEVLALRKYIKMKRTRSGMKLFCLCPGDQRLRGYTWDFQIRIDRDEDDVVSRYPGASELCAPERIVVCLADRVLNQGRHIVVGSWHMSDRLASFLLTQKTHVTGSVRSDVGVPKEAVEEKLDKGETRFVRNRDLLLVRWRDKADVNILTTKYAAGFVQKTRVLTGGARVGYSKPFHIEKYSALLGAVGACDQHLETYDPCRKSLVWFKKLGIHFIARMMLNGRVLYQLRMGKGKKPYLEYLLQCCDEMLMKHCAGYAGLKQLSTARERPATPAADAPLHAFVSIPPTQAKRRPQKRCRVCYENQTRKDTRKMCSGCRGNPGFCCIDHFNDWHRVTR